MMTIIPAVDDHINKKIIQSWWEIPSITYFCRTFEKICDLGWSFHVEDLEDALTLKKESWLDYQVMDLLKGCCHTKFSTKIYSTQKNLLKHIFQENCDKENNPYDTDIPFYLLPVRKKVEVLQYLCEIRLQYIRNNEINIFDIDTLRIKPLGYDGTRTAYWYFNGTRLYQEQNSHTQKSSWRPICLNKTDWLALQEKFKTSNINAEKHLYEQLRGVTKIALRLLKARQRAEKLRLWRTTPKRSSRRKRTTTFTIGNINKCINYC